MEGLLPQSFSGNVLQRSAERDSSFLRSVIAESSILLVWGRKVGVETRKAPEDSNPGPATARLAWLTANVLSECGVTAGEDGRFVAKIGVAGPVDGLD